MRPDGLWPLAVAWLASHVVGCATLAPQPATPQRPAFSSDTGTTAPGTLEVEAGTSVSRNYQDGAVALKWGATPEAELFVRRLPVLRQAPDVLASTTVGDVDLEHGLAAAYAFPSVQNLDAFAELTGLLVPTLDLEIAFTTIGVGYAVAPDLVLDAAFSIALTSDAPESRGTVGLTWNLGNPFGK